MRKYNQGVADSNRKRTKHGGAANGKTTKMYAAWRSIKGRCLNPNTQHYHRYGGRGIIMWPAWVDSFEQFHADVGEPTDNSQTLDRIDNERGYEPGNTRWVGRKEQANNRTTNVVVTYNGETHTLTGWAARMGWKYGLIASRWKKGLRGDDLFAQPKYERNKVITFNGESKTLTKWATDTGIPYYTLWSRLKNGQDLLG